MRNRANDLDDRRGTTTILYSRDDHIIFGYNILTW